MKTLWDQSYRAHGQAEVAQLQNICDGHAHEVQLAKEKKREEYDAGCCGCRVQQRRPQRQIAASQHEHENQVFKRLIDTLPAQKKRRVEHSRGEGSEHDAGGVQVKRGGQGKAPRMHEAFQADKLQLDLLTRAMMI